MRQGGGGHEPFGNNTVIGDSVQSCAKLVRSCAKLDTSRQGMGPPGGRTPIGAKALNTLTQTLPPVTRMRDDDARPARARPIHFRPPVDRQTGPLLPVGALALHTLCTRIAQLYTTSTVLSWLSVALSD